MANQRIDIDVGLKVDKTGLNQIKSSLQEIKNLTAQDLMKIGGHNDIKQAQGELDSLKRSIAAIDGALDKAFNTDLGTLNVSKFNQALKGMNLGQVYKDFSAAGAAGQSAFRNITSQILTTNMQLKQTHNFLNNMATTMANTVKWGVASSVMNNFTGSVQKAYGYVKSLDTSLNDIRIVTGKSADEMERFAVKANNAAKELGKSTTDYTKASLIYYQQGLSDKDVAARAETTLKAANVTGQSGEAVSEQLTAVWNGYKVGAEEAELYIDKLAAVAATTAADLEELSTGMSKVASAADLMGVDIDQLNAQMATIVSVTRQAPESVGTALKTIYARMGDIEAGLDAETTLGHYTEEMKAMGVNVLDANGELRDMGAVIEEIGGNWKNMTREQQISLSQTMAGTRQYNNLLSLFDNWDMYTKALDTSASAAGTLQKQQDIYMESTQAHLNQLRAASEDLYDSLLDPKGLNPLIDGLTTVTNLFSNFIDSIGGGLGVLLLLGATGSKVFNQQLASGIATFITNLQGAKENASILAAEMAILNQFENANIDNVNTQRLIEMKREVLNLDKSITNEERNIANEYIKQQNALFEQQDELENKLKNASQLYTQMTGVQINPDSVNNKNNLKAGLEEELTDFKNYEDDIKSTTDAFNNLTAARKNYDAAMQGKISGDRADKAVNDYIQALDTQGETIKDNIYAAEDLAASNRLQKNEQENLTSAINNYNKACKEQKTTSLENAQVLSAARKVQEAYKTAIKNTQQNIKNSINDIQNHAQATQQAKDKADQLTQSWNNFIKQINLKAQIQQVISFVGGIGQVAMGLNSLQQIGSIWNNDDLSVGEKTLQLITSFSMGLPMLVKGISTSINSLKTLIAAVQQFNFAKMISNQELLKDINLTGVKTAKDAMALVLQKAGVALSKDELKTLTLTNATKILIQKARNKEITLQQKELILKQLRLIAEKQEQASVLKTVLAYIKKQLVMAGPYLLAATAAVGIIWALVKAHNAESEAVQRANESLERQINITNRLKSEYESLQELIEGYEDAYNSLKTLEKGTEEYAQALIEANEKAKGLIETLNLFGQWEYGEDGLIALNEADVQAAYDQKARDVAASELELQAAYRRSNEAKWEEMKSSNRQAFDRTGTETRNSEDNMQDLAKVSDEIYNEIKNIVESYSTSSQEYLTAIDNLNHKYENSKVFLYDLGLVIEELGSQADETRSQIQDIIAEEEYRNQQIAKSSAQYQNLFDGYEIAENAYANLLSQSESFKNAVEENSQLTNTNVNNYDFKGLLREKGEDFGLVLDDKELSEYYAKYVEKWSDDEIKKAKYEKGFGEGTLTYGDKSFSMKDEDMRQEIYAALLASNLAKGLNKDGEAAYDDTQAKADVKAISDNSQIEQTTKDAVLTAMSNYNESNKDFNDLDLSLIHPDDMQSLLEQANQMSSEIGNALTEKLNSVSPEEQQDLYNKRLEEQHNQNIDKQAQAEGLDSQVLERQTELILENTEALQENENAAKQLAVNNTLMNRGMETLIDNWKDWEKVLKKGDKNTAEYAETITEVSECVEDLVGLSDGMGDGLSSSFFESAENLELLDEAAKGSEEAVEKLGYAVAEDLVDNMDFDAEGWAASIAEMGEAFEGIQFSDGLATSAAEMQTHFNTAKAAVLSGIEQIKNAELGVGDNLANALSPEDLSSFVNGLNDMALATGMSVQEMQGMLNSLSLQATVTTTPVPTTYQVPIMRTEEQIKNNGENGEPIVKESKTWQVGTESKQGVMDVAQVSYDGNTPGAAPITKIGHGSTSTGNRNKGSGGKGGGGKKGGGGGGGSAKKQKEEHVKTEKDRYHDVNVKLKQIDKELEDIGHDQEKYFGKDLIKALNKELDILEKQKKVYKEKLDITKQEQKELQKSLKSDGVKFNSDGTISNYEKALQAQEDALNKLIDKYNKLPASKQEKFKEEVLEPAKEEFEKFKENIERYDELLLDEIPDIEDSLQEIADREIEINVQKLKMEVEIRLDLSEAEKDWNEFQREVIDGIDSDDILGNAQSDKNLYETLLGNGTLEGETNKIKNIMKAINDINTKGSSEIYGDNKQLAMDDLKEAMDEIMGSMTDLNDLKKNIDEAYLDMIDEMGDAFDNQTESLEYVNELLEHNVNLTELLHGEDAYAEMAKHYEDIVANNLKIIAANQEAAAFYKNKMQTETDPEAAEKWKELWKDAVAELNDSVENSIQTITDQYMNSIDLAFDKMKEKLASLVGDGKNKKDFGYYSLEWELANEEAEKYLGTMDKAYELQKLGNKYQKSINDTSSVKAQRELNKLMDEEMKKLREKDKLTQYDIDRANARYELKLKEIALEEAQQNKSQMRLRRDSSGNYSYQFVADEEAIANAEQEVADATHSLFEMDQDEMNQKGQEYLDTMQEWNERLKEVDIEDKEARELINKEYQERLKLIQEDYLSIEQNLYESAFMDRALLYDENIATYQAMSDKEREILMNEMVPTWDTGVRQMMDAMVGPEGLGPACEQAMEDLKDATDTYNESLAAIESTAKTTFDTTKTEYTENIALANDLVKEAQDLVTETQNELTAVNDLKQGVDTLATSYETVYKNATDALTAAQNLWKAEQEHAAEEAKKNNPDPDGDGGKTSTTEGKKDDNEGKTSTSESGKGDKTLKKGDRVTYESGKYYYTSEGDSPTGTKKRGKKVYITKIKKGAKYPIHISTGSSLGDGDLGWLKEKQLKFDTGGYTGDWAGNDGKTAILHKKELVLNAKDTENVLATVNIVRDMQSMIDSLNNSILSRTNGFMDSINANLGFDTNFGTDLNQQVSIQASFPNVSSRMEIEQAFENLVNLASQHAFDTRR